ncbi:HAD family hydrolase [Ornithinicoccus hortensis]|uniref:HAD superfamily hydrolase (TIGR01509 family)/HAD superfamily hydrolase (TIGR01549 family) n=1 Tax=Ornithinicoccus hortensis TaxID=82346 RepID=A0A542YRJ4_9MICO|nr:HAD family hydrolase [Ornithinicoccus hortensis]TQL50726.1 HAD superfamily hydrolase (TIGR01509 family)/HAD superfamily hydrolase (TIGR01549 family) [Ornithinicoccus hortensis]
MTAPPITAVLFDFHQTLVTGGDAAGWLADGWADTGRGGDPVAGLGAAGAAEAAAFLDRVWEHAREVDPHAERDTDPRRHRAVFEATVARCPGIDTDLAAGLYRTMADRWEPFDDTVPVLRELRRRGVRTAVVSNIGFDVTGRLAETGIAPLVDAVLMSYAVGSVKPDPGIFEQALDRLGVGPEESLMVGDSWRDDGGAASLGIRTLLLPRTAGPVHGLGAVLGLVASLAPSGGGADSSA